MQGFCSRKMLLSTTDYSSGEVCLVTNRDMYSLNEKYGDFMYFYLLGSGESIIFHYLGRCRDDTQYCLFYSIAKPTGKSLILSRATL